MYVESISAGHRSCMKLLLLKSISHFIINFDSWFHSSCQPINNFIQSRTKSVAITRNTRKNFLNPNSRKLLIYVENRHNVGNLCIVVVLIHFVLYKLNIYFTHFVYRIRIDIMLVICVLSLCKIHFGLYKLNIYFMRVFCL